MIPTGDELDNIELDNVEEQDVEGPLANLSFGKPAEPRR